MVVVRVGVVVVRWGSVVVVRQRLLRLGRRRRRGVELLGTTERCAGQLSAVQGPTYRPGTALAPCRGRSEERTDSSPPFAWTTSLRRRTR